MHRFLLRPALAAALATLAACGGNHQAAAPADPVPVTVQGVTTPPSVSVVTAKNLE